MVTDSFSAQEISAVSADIEKWSTEAQQNANSNKDFDISFKIALLVIAVAALFGSGYAATFQDPAPPKWVKMSNIVLTGLATVLSAFAYVQFNFAQRQA